jgi:hypothetical protein
MTIEPAAEREITAGEARIAATKCARRSTILFDAREYTEAERHDQLSKWWASLAIEMEGKTAA